VQAPSSKALPSKEERPVEEGKNVKTQKGEQGWEVQSRKKK
jgi:hypothetical protein